jgi:two-component system, NarL family, sensor histidine kinase LiaS
LLAALLSFPSALLLVWLFVRPLIERVSKVAKVSASFANGDLQARVQDKHGDEIAQMAQQFDSMGDALQQNVHVLRDMAHTNAALAQQAEASAVQAERLRLGRDLHDAIAQRLFSLTISTATLPDVIAHDQARGVQQAQLIAAIAEQTLLDLRTVLIDLRPTQLIEHGVQGALEALCQQWRQAHHIPIDLSVVLSGQRLSAGVETALYAITQEALNNIAKHAQATQVSVSIIQGQKQIILSVSDNGRGIASKMANGGAHFGLTTMRERAAALGGRFELSSDAGNGTTVQVTLPLSSSNMP